MGLESILDKIKFSGESQVAAIEEETETRQADILNQAQKEAELILAKTCAQSNLQAERQRARIIQQARVEALQTLGQAREHMIEKTLDQIQNELTAIRGTTKYTQVMKRLIEEALDGLAGSQAGPPRLSIDARDQELAAEILKSMGLDLPISSDITCRGGLIATSNDGKVVAINTFESRLERADPFIKGHLAALFEQVAESGQTREVKRG